MPGQLEGKGSVRRVELTVTEKKAVDLRIAGNSYQKIAEALDYTLEGARQVIFRAMEVNRNATKESCDELRQIEVQRLDDLLASLWPKALNGDMKAVDRVLKVAARRAALLGLDMPQQVQVAAVLATEDLSAILNSISDRVPE